jgi:hypothetical protein
MSDNRIARLERDLVGRRRRRGRRGARSDPPRVAAERSSRALNADDGDAITLLCDGPTRRYPAAAWYAAAFDDEAVDTVAAVDVDAAPSIDDPTIAGRADPTTSVAGPEPTAGGAHADPTIAGGTVDPTTGAGTADPTIASVPRGSDPTVETASPPARETAPTAAAQPSLTPTTTAPDDMGGWQVTGEAADQETAFAQDIATILAHTSGDEAAPTPAPAAVPAAVQSPASPAAAPQMGVGATSGHDVFDRMAAANRYDQGPVVLSVDFAAMDRAIDRGETTAPPSPPAAAADAAAPPAPAPAPDALTRPTSAPVAAPDAAPQGPGAAPSATTPTTAGPVPPAPAPPAPAGRETVPAAPLPSADVADVAAVDAITAASGPFRVATDVPLVAQVPGLSCHAAACASIVAWRDDVNPVATDVAAATGYWERFADGRTAVYPDVLDAFGLTHSVVGPAPTATALKDLIERAGPLWVAASPPGERAVVIAGATGDGTSSGTMVDVVDPWARGMTTFSSPNPGSTYHQSLAELLSGIAGGTGNPVVIAQLKEGPTP